MTSTKGPISKRKADYTANKEVGHEALARAVVVQAAEDHYRKFFDLDEEGKANPWYLFWSEAAGIEDQNIEPIRRQIWERIGGRRQNKRQERFDGD